MTERSVLIQIILKELRRQANRDGKLVVTLRATDKPDTVHVKGVLDMYELATAVLDH